VSLDSADILLVPVQVSVVSTVIATLFLRTTLNAQSQADGQTYLGLIFFAIIHMVRPWSFGLLHLSHLNSVQWSLRREETAQMLVQRSACVPS
jgi:hypothetical protein